MIPAGWTIKRADKRPFKRIELSIEHGRGMRYTAIVDSLARNPENILYMLAEDLLAAEPAVPMSEIRAWAERYDIAGSSSDGHLRAMFEDARTLPASGVQEVVSAYPNACNKRTKGWLCSRMKGHDGECDHTATDGIDGVTPPHESQGENDAPDAA